MNEMTLALFCGSGKQYVSAFPKVILIGSLVIGSKPKVRGKEMFVKFDSIVLLNIFRKGIHLFCKIMALGK